MDTANLVSRRTVLHGFIATTLIPSAALASQPAEGLPANTSVDAELLSLASQYHAARTIAEASDLALESVARAARNVWTTLPAQQRTFERLMECGGTELASLEDENEASWGAADAIARRILALRPATAAGALAKLRVAMCEAHIEDAIPRADQDWGPMFLNAAMDDLALVVG